MPASVKAVVRQRAGNRCEYCLRPQEASPLVSLQLEHIIARKHGGNDGLENLALACAECNLHKSSDLAGIDPESGQLTPLFHPRQDAWDEHFEWIEEFTRIQGRTAIGRATIVRLKMNRPALVVARQRWVEGGYHPPEG